MKPIDFQDLHGDLNETLADYFVAVEAQAKAYKRQALARFNRDRYWAREWLILKDDIQDNGRPISNDAAENEIRDDEDYQALEKKYIAERTRYEKALGMVRYLEYRLDAVRTVEATQRTELQNNLKQ